MQHVEELTEIPFSGQKLICQAKTLTSNDPYKTTLASCNLINGSKVMVLGRKTDPVQDESYQKIVAIEKNILEMAQKFVDISKQVHEITHLPKEHHETALRDLGNRCTACSEEWVNFLESLDNVKLDDNQLSKSKRKSVVVCASSYIGKKHALKKYYQSTLNTSCSWEVVPDQILSHFSNFLFQSNKSINILLLKQKFREIAQLLVMDQVFKSRVWEVWP